MPEVQDADGVTWRVKRRWLPWRLRRRDPDIDFPSGLEGDDIVIGLIVIGVLLLFAFLFPIVLVAAALAAEFVLLLALLPIVVLVRASRVGRWPIEIWRGEELVETGSARGWRASSERINQIVDEIRTHHLSGESAST